MRSSVVRKEDTKHSKEGLTVCTPQDWLAKVFEKATGKPLGEGHPLDSYGATELYPMRVSDPWIGGREERLVSWRAAPVKDEKAGKELFHELLRRAVGLVDEEADIHKNHAQRGWYSFCRDDWVTRQDFDHCVACRSCRDTVERGYHWTCGKCRICVNGANERCPKCDGISYGFRGDFAHLVDDYDLDEGDDDDGW